MINDHYQMTVWVLILIELCHLKVIIENYFKTKLSDEEFWYKQIQTMGNLNTFPHFN